MLLEELLAVYPARDVIGDRAIAVERIVTDSRQASFDALFVARHGTRSDGLQYVRDAYDRGCRVVASDHYPELLPADCTFVLVDDVHQALALWSQALWGFPARQLELYGVTGTNGKTTTTFILAQLLEACGVRAGVIGTLGVRFGNESVPTLHTTPDAPELAQHMAWLLERGARAVAMEVSSHGLQQRRTEGLTFAGAIFTNLTPDHLDYHRTMEQYAQAKKKLFDALPPSAYAAVCADSPWAEVMVSSTLARVIRVGRSAEADVCICKEHSDGRGSQWQLRWRDGRVLQLRMPLVGSFNVDNASLAVVLLSARGYDVEELATALQTVTPPPGRMERIELPGGVTAVVDYAHTPDALERVLQQCRMLINPAAQLYCVFGCGGERDESKRPHMGAIAARLADVVIITSDNPRSEDPTRIAEQIYAGIEALPSAERRATVHIELDRRRAIRMALEMARAGDCILVGGKGHEEVQIIGTERHPFSDRAVIEEYGKVSKS